MFSGDFLGLSLYKVCLVSLGFSLKGGSAIGVVRAGH
jgi:hypothetical protein